MVHTQIFSAAKLISIGIIEILLDCTCDGSLLCCCIAISAGGVVNPWHRLVGSAHSVAGTLIGQFLDSTSKGFCHGNCKVRDHDTGCSGSENPLTNSDGGSLHKSMIEISCLKARFCCSGLIQAYLQPSVWCGLPVDRWRLGRGLHWCWTTIDCYQEAFE